MVFSILYINKIVIPAEEPEAINDKKRKCSGSRIESGMTLKDFVVSVSFVV
jgi:hypothetical protein